MGAKKEHSRYTYMSVSDMTPHNCWSFCDHNTHRSCAAAGECQQSLPGAEQCRIAGKIWTARPSSDDLKTRLEWDQEVHDAVQDWRKKKFKQCRKVTITFEKCKIK